MVPWVGLNLEIISLLTKNNNQNQRRKQELEETYERLYPKIGRDFVHIDDVKELLEKINIILHFLAVSNALPPQLANLEILPTHALSKAIMYKDTVEGGKDGSKIFKDIIKIDEDE